MLRPQLQSFIKISLPTNKRLTRQSGDQIEVNVSESGVAQSMKGAFYVSRTVCAAEQFQLAIVKGLRAKTCAIYSQAAKLHHRFTFRGGTCPAVAWIHLNRNFRAVEYNEAILDCF